MFRKILTFLFIVTIIIGCGGGGITPTPVPTSTNTPAPTPTNTPVSGTHTPTPATSPTNTPTPGGMHNLTNLFFLHHSVGDGLVVEGNMRDVINAYNSAHSTNYMFWDHGYNSDGLRNPDGKMTETNYNIPDDNTDPEGLWYLWTSSEADAQTARNKIMENHQVIAFKSCFPASAIPDKETLNQYKTWYLDMRDFFDQHPEKLFVVMSTPPLREVDTNATEAANARAFANWLKSDEYLSDHPNVVCFDLFDYLAGEDNFLKDEYETEDSHPNTLANKTVGLAFAQFLIEEAENY